MKLSFLSAGLILAGLGLASAGCSQTGQKDMSSKFSKTADPSAWNDSDGMTGSSSLPKSSGLYGGLSSESRAIEKSLGVGQ